MAAVEDAVCSVYVGNLCLSTPLADMEELVYELFLQAGPLEKVFLPYDRESGRHKGFGFVDFDQVESVQYSIDLLHGLRLCGRSLTVRRATPRTASTSQETPATAPATLLFEPASTQAGTTQAGSTQPSVGAAQRPPSLMGIDSNQDFTFNTAHLVSSSSASIPSLFPSTQHSPQSVPPSLFHQSQSNNSIPRVVSSATRTQLQPSNEPRCFKDTARFTRAVIHGERYPENNHLPLNSAHLHPSPTHYPSDTSHCRLHESRLRANDYPPWFSPLVRHNMAQYHMHMLENTLQQVKTILTSHTR